MPSQDSIFEQKKKFIEQATALLDSTFTSLADELLKALINEFADKLERDGDIILNTPKNLQLIAAIETIYNNFSQFNLPGVASQIITGADKINAFNVDYFGLFDSDKRAFKASVEKIQQIIQDRLGVTRGSPGAKVTLKPGGYMDSLLQDNTVKNQIKELSYREVLKQIGFQDFKRGLENFIVGDEERLGGFRQYYRNYAYSIFVDVDSAEGSLFATDLGLTYFIYEGTLIDTSREFCIKRAGKVFSLEEAEQWVHDPWIKNAIDKGYIASYDPVQDMGLHAFGCRHTARFISKEVAEKLRPDLKGTEIAFAAFREKNVSSIAEDKAIRDSPEFKLYMSNVNRVAEALGLNISSKVDTWGGYVDNETGRFVQEVSNIIHVTGDPKNIELMAAILGKSAPEIQDSVLMGNYQQGAAGTEHTISTGNFDNALKSIKYLKENNIENYSIDKNSGNVILLDPNDVNLNNILNFVNNLKQNNLYEDHIFEHIEAKFIGQGDYGQIIAGGGSQTGTQAGFDIDAFIKEAIAEFIKIQQAKIGGP